MRVFTHEQIDAALDKLPTNLRDYLSLEQNTDKIIDIATTNHLDEERQIILSSTAAHTIIGLLHPEDLAKELADRLRVEKRVAEGLAKEVLTKLLYPIANELAQTHGFHIEGAPSIVKPVAQPTQQTMAPVPVFPSAESAAPPPIAVPPTPTVEPEETILKPHVQKEDPSTEPFASPLILHEHKDVEAARGTINYAENLARPSFHIPEDYGARTGEYAEPAPTARLELGAQAEPEAYIEPKTTRVGKEEAKIVHYTAPDVQADPFSRAPEPAAKPAPEPVPQAPKPNVHPDNIVNLKDLPR